MTQKWNLQDIRPSTPRRKPAVPPQTTNLRQPQSETPRRSEVSGSDDDSELVPVRDGKKDSKRRTVYIGIGVFALVGAAFAVSAFLSKTTLTVYPEYSEPVVNAEFTAYPDRRDGQLSYEVLTIESTKEKQVQASGKEYSESKATGMIEISKSTAGTERLIANTRFRSADGKIFRITEPVVIPGAVKDTSGGLLPGRIRATVVADQVGEEYNLTSGAKFDIPGFKESDLTALYDAISATNPESFTGGFKGDKFLIDEAQLSEARQELQLALRDELLARSASEKPAGFTSFTTATALTFTQLPTISYGDDLVTIREQAVLQLPLFKEGDFAAFVAEQTITTYDEGAVRIADTSTLNFAYTDPTTNSSNIANATALTFKLAGKPTIIYEFDAEKLQEDLAGKSRTAISTVLTGHPGIKSARVSTKPFWRRSFPEDADDIVIVEVVGEEK